MESVQHAFYEASHWNVDNSYGALNASARALLDFDIPRGLRMQISSLAAPNFATSYTLGSVGIVDGSVSYLYSSLPLRKDLRTSHIDLHHVIRGYKHAKELRRPDEKWSWEVWHAGQRIDRKNTLLYGRIFLPQSRLEALYLRRLGPTRQLRIAAVSDSNLNNGGTILTLLQNDMGRYSTEYMYSTDSALMGVRGLYNFGPDGRLAGTEPMVAEQVESVHGRFSAGAELYYGILNKSGGISTGLRFATLPNHAGFPYTMTLTLNPLMGNLSSTYAVKAGRNLALSSRFDFNFYSYESEVQLGCELWRIRSTTDVDWAVKKLRPDWKRPTVSPDDDVSGVLKARVDQDWRVGVLWEGRLKELLFTLGASLDLLKREQIFRSVGIELQYSS
ncbi:Mitochondrial distribution and morphology protein [Pyrenophora teres f. maculata]|nr:Mitochondrial distribution and morphology protein [Pyrenophora teres f. maculata]